MTVTDRDIAVLRLLRRYKFLTTSQIRKLVFTTDKDGSITRDRLRKLEAAGYVVRRRAEVAVLTSSTVPVWMLTEQGCCALAIQCDDATPLLDAPPQVRAWHCLAHWVAVSDVHIKIDQAIAAQDRVTLHDLFFEHDVINADETDAEKRFKLHTIVHEQGNKRIVCAGDSAFEIEVDGFRRAFYVELERGSDTPSRMIAKKHKGYFHLNANGLYRKHFPQAHDMRVLVIAPNPSWRDALRKAARKITGAELWMFCCLTDVRADSFLHGDIFWTVADGPRPFVRPAGSPAAGVGNGGAQQVEATGT